jgi:23S rRNA (guanosine2251-2'-O)-methyltransferase
MTEWIYGRNPVYEVLRAGRRQVLRLLVAEGAQRKGQLLKTIDLCNRINVPVEQAQRNQLDRIQPGNQGLLLEVSDYPYATLIDILDLPEQRDETPLILLLDSLQDPQNLGTLLRTAEAVGVHGVLLPFRRTATITPAVVNASSGASEHLLVTQANLAQAIKTIKQLGIWVVGLDNAPDAQPVNKSVLDGPIAFVIGAEGQGMRPLIRKSCDLLIQLPMRGKIESLNAAVAGSIALYLTWQTRGFNS